MPYFPDKVGIYSGTSSITYVLMTAGKELVVFIIQAIFKKEKNLVNILNQSNTRPRQQHPRQHVTEDKSLVLDEMDSIENFKMARRCTIQMQYTSPKLMESYADYFIIGKYAEKPF